MKFGLEILSITFMAFVYFNQSDASSRDLEFAMLEGSEAQNIALCVIQEAYKNIGITTKFKKFPTSRSMVLSDRGKYDGELSRVQSIQKKYTNLIIIPIPTIQLRGMAFTKNFQDFSPNGFDSLSPFKIVINQGAQFARNGTAALPKVYKANDYKAVFMTLLKDRVDFAVAPYSNSIGLLRQLNITEIEALNPPLIKIPLYHFLHKKNQSLVPSIKAALTEMDTRGRIDKIYYAYLERLRGQEILPNYNNLIGPSVTCPPELAIGNRE